MTNILVAYDDDDPENGRNSLLCFEHFQNNLPEDYYNIISFNGSTCHCGTIENTITSLQQVPFIFIAYSHGHSEGLKSFNHGDYVNIYNSYFFHSALFYTNACSTAQVLKDALLMQDCRVYVGYNDIVYIPDSLELENLFVECENSAINLFLNSDLTIGECFLHMKDTFDNKCDELIAKGEFLYASRLADNRSELIIGGDITTTRAYYFH